LRRHETPGMGLQPLIASSGSEPILLSCCWLFLIFAPASLQRPCGGKTPPNQPVQSSGPSHVITVITRGKISKSSSTPDSESRTQLPTSSNGHNAISVSTTCAPGPSQLGHAMRLRQLCGCLRPATKSAPPEVSSGNGSAHCSRKKHRNPSPNEEIHYKHI